MKTTLLIASTFLLLIGSLPMQGADEHGHDHGAAPAAVAASPRFAAASEAFELVGILDGKRLALYLDHAPDNSPVKNARLELEVGGVKVVPVAKGEGEFEATLATVPASGVLGVTAVVAAGEVHDLLGADLEIPQLRAESATSSLRRWIVGAGIALAAVAALLVYRHRRSAPTSGGLR